MARAARAAGVPLIVSTVSSYSLEQIAKELDATPDWFRLYWPGDRDLATSLLHRAHRAGYQTLVVTLDNVLMGWRPRDLQRGYLPFLRGDGPANYPSDPVFQQQLGARREADIDMRKAVTRWSEISADPTLTWDDLSFLRDNWPGPIVLKGILHPDDARRAVDAGIDGIGLAGEHGVQHVLRTLLADYDLTCGLAGHTGPHELNSQALQPTTP